MYYYRYIKSVRIYTTYTYRSAVAALSLIYDLWRHVLQRARERLGGGAEPRQTLGCTEVRDLHHPAVRVYQHIIAFDVPVDYLLIVQVFQT